VTPGSRPSTPTSPATARAPGTRASSPASSRTRRPAWRASVANTRPGRPAPPNGGQPPTRPAPNSVGAGRNRNLRARNPHLPNPIPTGGRRSMPTPRQPSAASPGRRRRPRQKADRGRQSLTLHLSWTPSAPRKPAPPANPNGRPPSPRRPRQRPANISAPPRPQRISRPNSPSTSLPMTVGKPSDP